MASYFNLTLDTLAPSGLTLSINDGALYATKTAVKLTIGLSDEQTGGYQMKIWGINGVTDEGSASWETFTTEKTVELTTGDGLKTVHIKVRDDVGNESAEVSDDITLNTAVPVVTITGPDKTKISKISGFDKAKISFTCDVDFEQYKVCVVPQNSSTQDSEQPRAAKASSAQRGVPPIAAMSLKLRFISFAPARAGAVPSERKCTPAIT